jgi:hypothetical protein
MLNATPRAVGSASLMIAVLSSASAFAQTPLFSNGSPSASTPALAQVSVTASGTTASPGTLWSEVSALGTLEANAVAGIQCGSDASDSSGGLRLADNFTVPAGVQWNLQQLWVYAYAQRPDSTASPVASATVRIWQGTPGGVTSSVVFGNTSTNRLASVTATSTYRVFTTTVGSFITPPDTTRRVFRVAMSTPVALGPGQYWIDWQLTPVAANTPLYAANTTLAGVRTQAGWNSLQFVDGTWTPVLDPGKPAGAADVPQDIAFILAGDAVPACDSIDFNGDGLFPDTGDIDDFISVFSGGACSTGTCADIDFNNDGLFPDTADIDSLLSSFSGGPCL